MSGYILCHSGGRALRDINDSYRLSPSLNYVSSSSYMKAKTNSMDINDMEVFIPANELHLKNPRKYRIYVKMSIYTDPGKTGEFLAESDYIPFLIDMSDLQGPDRDLTTIRASQWLCLSFPKPRLTTSLLSRKTSQSTTSLNVTKKAESSPRKAKCSYHSTSSAKRRSNVPSRSAVLPG